MDCNIQVINFQFSSVTCILCLSENLSAPYTDLSEDVVKAEDIRHVLTLQCSLHDNLHHPRHVCSTCTTTIDAFTTLRDLALKNELILHVKESYSEIVIKQQADNEVIDNEMKLDNEVDHEYHDDIYNEICDDLDPVSPSKESENIKNENNKDSKENIDGGPIKITIKKTHLENKKKPNVIMIDNGSKKSRVLDTEKTLRSQKVRSIVDQLIKDMKADPKDPNLRFNCPMCDSKNAKNMKKYALHKHLKWIHKEADLPCKYEGCKVTFKHPKERQKHYRIVHEKEKELCTYCGDYFKNVQAHIRNNHEGEKQTCPHCSKEYTSESGLEYHIKICHTDGALEVCHICAKEFKDLKKHIKYSHQGGNQIMKVQIIYFRKANDT